MDFGGGFVELGDFVKGFVVGFVGGSGLRESNWGWG